MAIQIPTIQKSGINSNVRRLDVGQGSANSRTLAAKEQVNQQFNKTATAILQLRADAKNVADEAKHYTALSTGMSQDIKNLPNADADGNVTISSPSGVTETIPYQEAVSNISAKYKEPISTLDVSPKVRERLSVKIGTEGQRAGILAEGTVNIAKAKGIKDAGMQMTEQISKEMQVSPDRNVLAQRLGDMNTYFNEKAIQLANGKEDVSKERQLSNDTIVGGYVEGVLDKADAGEARKLLDEKGIQDLISSKQLMKLNNKVQAVGNRQTAANRKLNTQNVKNQWDAYSAGTYNEGDTAKALLRLKATEKDPIVFQNAAGELAKVSAADEFTKQSLNNEIDAKGYMTDVDDKIESMGIVDPIIAKKVKADILKQVTKIDSGIQANMYQDGATFLSQHNDNIKRKMQTAMASTRNFQEFKADLDYYYDIHGIPESRRNYFPDAMIKKEVDILNFAEKNNDPRAALEVVNQIRVLDPDNFINAFNMFTSGTELEATGKLSDKYVAAAYMQDPVSQENMLAATFSKELNDSFAIKFKKEESDNAINYFETHESVGFMSAMAGGSPQARDNGFFISKQLGILYKRGRVDGMSDTAAKSDAIKKWKEGYTFSSDKRDAFAIPKNANINRDTIDRVTQTIRSSDSDLLKRIAPMIDKRDDVTMEQVKEGMQREMSFINSPDMKGLEVWGGKGANRKPITYKDSNGIKKKFTLSWDSIRKFEVNYKNEIDKIVQKNEVRNEETLKRLSRIGQDTDFMP